MIRRAALAVLLVLATFAAAGGRPDAARAQAPERITAYAVDITVQADGVLRIVEDIDYDFGADARHGIFRDIPTRIRYDQTHDRTYALHVERVEADPGASAAYALEAGANPGETRIRIGDANRTITGAHHYRITYTIADALNGFTDHDELYWNAIGAQWTVPIARAAVAVHLPAADVPQVACYAGATGSALGCASATSATGGATFAEPQLGSFEGLTVVVGFPPGRVPTPHPVLVELWSLAKAFTLDVPRAVLALALLVAGVWLVVRLVWREGRDVRWRGAPVNVVFGGTEGEQRVPLFEGGAYAIEYTPPDDIRPGEIGTLLDERADPRDVAASVVDLAARGYLHIEEIPGQGWLRRTDWRLTRQPPPTEQHRTLRPYETALLDALFEDGGTVLLSSLNRAFAARFQQVRDALYQDVVALGWFEERPDQQRVKWLSISVAALAVSCLVEGFAIAKTHVAVVPVGLVIASLLLLALHGRMPRRTAKGTATLRRTLGFREFIATAETRRAEFAEHANLFYEYLPYAVVFGCVDHWARTFEGLALEPPTWYGGYTAFNAIAFGEAVHGFTQTSSTFLAATPSGGASGFGGGFAGGGGGGGGGGSW